MMPGGAKQADDPRSGSGGTRVGAHEMGRDRVAAVTLRWVRLQLSVRVAPGEVLATWLLGSLFCLPMAFGLALADDSLGLVALAPLGGSLYALVFASTDLEDGASVLPRRVTSFESSRLRLRAPRADDATAISETIDDEVVRANGWLPAERRMILLATRHPQLLRAGFVVAADRETDVVLGVVLFSAIDPDMRTAHVGLWLGPTARGRGLGTELVSAATQLAWRLGLLSVRLATSSSNVAMRRCAEWAGGWLIEETPHRLSNGTIVSACQYVLMAPRAPNAVAPLPSAPFPVVDAG
jgi:RimJ/RimL family protein N-acetyltransferase